MHKLFGNRSLGRQRIRWVDNIERGARSLGLETTLMEQETHWPVSYRFHKRTNAKQKFFNFY